MGLPMTSDGIQSWSWCTVPALGDDEGIAPTVLVGPGAACSADPAEYISVARQRGPIVPDAGLPAAPPASAPPVPVVRHEPLPGRQAPCSGGSAARHRPDGAVAPLGLFASTLRGSHGLDLAFVRDSQQNPWLTRAQHACAECGGGPVPVLSDHRPRWWCPTPTTDACRPRPRGPASGPFALSGALRAPAPPDEDLPDLTRPAAPGCGAGSPPALRVAAIRCRRRRSWPQTAVTDLAEDLPWKGRPTGKVGACAPSGRRMA
jgi:ribosomal protein S27AE